MAKFGEPCKVKDCDGYLVVYSTRIVGSSRVRYLKCCVCEHHPSDNQQVIPLEIAPARPRRRPIRRRPRQ